VLGRVVVELQQHVEVVGDPRDRFGPLGAVLGHEGAGSGLGVLAGGGEDVTQRGPEPERSVADGEHWRGLPRRLQSRSRSAHDSEDSRCPSVSATSSLVPSARTPIITSRQTLSCSRRTSRWIPSTHRYT
jgi:hypothetical protein